MSETQTTIQKNFKIIKTTAADVIFYLSPVSNPSVKRVIELNERVHKQSLPLDWALGVFQDENIYSMYKEGLFTFEDNDAIVKAAYENGYYFDEVLDFTPAKENKTDNIFAILNTGNRKSILDLINKYGRDEVATVATARLGELSTSVVRLLENTLGIQLLVDGE